MADDDGTARRCEEEAAHEHEEAAARQRAEAEARALDEEAACLRQEADAREEELHRVMLLHEATAIANLHAQAVVVQNIRALVPVVLDLVTPNYSKWCDRFLTTLGKYSLSDHVLTDTIRADSADWCRRDCVVCEWLYGTISPDLVEIVMAPHATARLVWLGLE